MAAGGSVADLCHEMTCPICLEYFQEPVILDCGHNFCHACLAQCWGEPGGAGASCPQCRETFERRSFKPNRHLANVVEIAKKLQEGKRAEGAWGVCEKHLEALKLFCKEDQAPICVVCDRSKDHQAHTVVPAEEAAQKYKENIKILLKSLEKKREQLVVLKEIQELRSQECMSEEDKQKVRSAIGRMHKILEEKEHEWLSQLEEMEKNKEENVRRLSEEIAHLSRLITEMEGKCQQPSHEFLQDLNSTLKRYKKEQVEHAVALFTWLESRLRTCSQKCSAVEKAVEKCTESLEEALKEECLETLDQALNKGSLKRMRHRVDVILDPDTAHHRLIVSPDLKSVRWGGKNQDVLDSPERFENMCSVLGHGKFSSGKHWWEVEVEVEEEEMEEEKMRGMWAVGVTPDSVMRKGGRSVPTPEEGFLVVGKLLGGSFSSGQLLAFTSPTWTTLTLNHEPRKIRVSLDYEERCIEFFDADTDDLIFTFPSASLSGEMIRPFFFLAGDIRMNC